MVSSSTTLPWDDRLVEPRLESGSSGGGLSAWTSAMKWEIRSLRPVGEPLGHGAPEPPAQPVVDHRHQGLGAVGAGADAM